MLRKTMLASAIAAFVAAPAGAGERFNANIFFGAAHPLAKYGYVDWAKEVETVSGGELKAEVFTGTALLEPRAGMSGVRDGIAQVGYHAAVYTPSDLPLSNAIQELGFNYDDPLLIAAAIADFNFNDAQMQEQWRSADVVYGGAYSTPPYVIFCREPVRNLEEIKGKRMRTSGASVSRWVESVGAIPVNVPSSEMYTGLEKGVLDCATNAANDLKSRSLWDVAKHTTLVPLGMYWSGPQWAYNSDFWAGLSEQKRRWLFDATATAMARLYIGYDEAAALALAEAPEHGVSVYEPEADMKGSVEAFRAASLEQSYAVAKERYGLEDGKALIDRFRQTVDKWRVLLEGVSRTDEAAIAQLLKTEIFDKIDVAGYGLN